MCNRLFISFILLVTIGTAADRAAGQQPSKPPNSHSAIRNLGMLSSQAAVRDRIGVNAADTARAADRALLRELGVGWIRFDVSWDAVEKKRGVYTFSEYDSTFAGLKQTGVKAMAILDYNNPLYAPASNFGFNDPADIQAFVKFATVTAERFTTPDVLWEFYNEPNQPDFWPRPDPERFMQLMAAGIPAMRNVAPAAVIIGPALGHYPNGKQPAPWQNELLDFPYLNKCLAEGLLQYVDALSIHPYPQHEPETLIGTYSTVRSLVDRYTSSKSVVLVSSETGYSTSSDMKVSEQQQADWLVRQWLINLTENIPITIFYALRDSPHASPDSERHYGLVRGDGSKKPAFIALSALLKEVGDLRYDGRLPSSKEDWLLRFAGSGRTVIVGWTIGSPHALKILGTKLALSASPTWTKVSK